MKCSLPRFRASTFSAGIFLCLFSHIQSVIAERNSDNSRNGPSSSNYKDALLIYPTGIRSERDLPVCPGWVVEEEDNKKGEVGPSHSPASVFGSNDISELQQPGSTRNPSDSSKKSHDGSKYLAACNIIHRRYFYQPMIERLCRCPDRTECPMEWSPPPMYKDLSNANNKQGSKQTVSTTPSSKSATSFDPFSVMVSSRTQLKFCTEVKAHLPLCEKPRKHKESSSDEFPAMVRTVRKTFLSPDLQSISVNCYCPPLYHGWSFLSKKLPLENGNITVDADANYSYRCDRLRKCKPSQHCGTVRTDYHFSYYHCACPKKHICVPKVYPPVSHDDVIEEVEEALYSGQLSPAFCTPE